jgi:hypothetical protein
MAPLTSGFDLLTLLALYAIPIGAAYEAPRFYIAQRDFNLQGLFAILLCEAMAFFWLFQSTPPDLDPTIVAAGIVLVCSLTGTINGIRTRRAETSRPAAAPFRAMRIREP